MSQELNIINLCENCATALRNTIDSNISRDLSISLNQKLFLLETALDDFKNRHIDFEEICNHSANALYVADGYGKTVYFNQSFLEFSGLKKEDLMEKNVHEIKSEKAPFINDIITKVINTKKLCDLKNRLVDEEISVTGLPIPDELGQLKYAMIHIQIMPVSVYQAEAESEPAYSTYLKNSQYNLKKSVESFEKDIIRDAIGQYGSKRKAASALGMDHSTLIKKCQRYGI